MDREKKIYLSVVIVLGLILVFNLYSYLSFMNSGRFDLLLNWTILLNILPTLVGLAGTIIFAATNFKRSALLRIYMCFIIFVFPFSILGIKWRFDKAQENNLNLFNNLDFTLNLVISSALIIFCCMGLWQLSKKRSPKLHYITIGGEAFSEFSPVAASRRFVNRLADLLVIIYILYTEIIDNYWLRHWLRDTGTGTLFLLEFLITFYYYVALEGIFNTSVGKCITNTLIVDDSGSRPGFGKIIGRTLCRYIPFEPFSFFGKVSRGWHDSMSGTYVVKAVNDDVLPAMIPDSAHEALD